VQLTAQIPHTMATVQILRGDITESGCEAITNASNESLDLENSGVSGSILHKGMARCVFNIAFLSNKFVTCTDPKLHFEVVQLFKAK